MEHKQTIEKRIERKVKHYVGKAFKVLFFVLFALAFAFLIGYVVMWLWNWLMPEVFGLPSIGYWQAVGILLLAKILFGFGTGGPNKGTSRNRKSKRFQVSKACSSLEKDYETWKHYDQFWKEEGEAAYRNYLERIQAPKQPE